MTLNSAVFSGGAGGARARPEFWGSLKGRSLISAYQSLAITTNTPGFEKLNTVLLNSFELNERRKRAFIYFEVLNNCAVTEKAIKC
jgi:hypothetical protein